MRNHPACAPRIPNAFGTGTPSEPSGEAVKIWKYNLKR